MSNTNKKDDNYLVSLLAEAEEGDKPKVEEPPAEPPVEEPPAEPKVEEPPAEPPVEEPVVPEIPAVEENPEAKKEEKIVNYNTLKDFEKLKGSVDIITKVGNKLYASDSKDLDKLNTFNEKIKGFEDMYDNYSPEQREEIILKMKKVAVGISKNLKNQKPK